MDYSVLGLSTMFSAVQSVPLWPGAGLIKPQPDAEGFDDEKFDELVQEPEEPKEVKPNDPPPSFPQLTPDERERLIIYRLLERANKVVFVFDDSRGRDDQFVLDDNEKYKINNSGNPSQRNPFLLSDSQDVQIEKSKEALKPVTEPIISVLDKFHETIEPLEKKLRIVRFSESNSLQNEVTYSDGGKKLIKDAYAENNGSPIVSTFLEIARQECIDSDGKNTCDDGKDEIVIVINTDGLDTRDGDLNDLVDAFNSADGKYKDVKILVLDSKKEFTAADFAADADPDVVNAIVQESKDVKDTLKKIAQNSGGYYIDAQDLKDFSENIAIGDLTQERKWELCLVDIEGKEPTHCTETQTPPTP